jgi:hypothetical protein
MRWAMSSVTGSPVKMEVPRSKRGDLPDHSPKRIEEGPVEAEALADLLHVVGGGLIAGDDGGRIAGRDVEQREDEQAPPTAMTGIVATMSADQDVTEHREDLLM